MKMKKLKKLLKAINDIAARPVEDIKGIIKTNYELSKGHPLVILPTKGKYVLPEVQIIDKIVRAIEPKEIVMQAMKVNLQTGMLVMSVYKAQLKENTMNLLVHTPKGCVTYQVESSEGFIMPPKDDSKVENV